MNQNLSKALQSDITLINEALHQSLSSDAAYAVLFDAMRYSL